MRMTEVDFGGGRPVEGYGPGFFRVAGALWHGALLLLPNGPRAWDGYADSGALLDAAPSIDLLLLGTGRDLAPPPADLRAAIEATGLGLEVMASPSACRTYNVLLAEGRRIGAALLPVAPDGA